MVLLGLSFGIHQKHATRAWTPRRSISYSFRCFSFSAPETLELWIIWFVQSFNDFRPYLGSATSFPRSGLGHPRLRFLSLSAMSIFDMITRPRGVRVRGPGDPNSRLADARVRVAYDSLVHVVAQHDLLLNSCVYHEHLRDTQKKAYFTLLAMRGRFSETMAHFPIKFKIVWTNERRQ